MSAVVLFVPGYATSKDCRSITDTYVQLADFVQSRQCDFEYLSMPNNNYGDIGNVDLDDLVEYVIQRYNEVCSSVLYRRRPIVLVGHSMGGLLVARMLSQEVIDRLCRLPTHVRLINPAIGAIVPTLVSTVVATVPDTLLRLMLLPGHLASNALYPRSLPLQQWVKPRLLVSILRRTGRLYWWNDAWTLDVGINLRAVTRIILCMGDTVCDATQSILYARQQCVDVVELESAYHAFFDTSLLTAVWDLVNSP
jgi:hypothetical protein